MNGGAPYGLELISPLGECAHLLTVWSCLRCRLRSLVRGDKLIAAFLQLLKALGVVCLALRRRE